VKRRSFVSAAAAAGAGLATGTVTQGDGAVRVPMPVEIAPSWLTWVTAANACLRALGCESDNVEVAGQSGYAFHMCITSVAGVEGPTTLPWEQLSAGCRRLGRATTEFQMGPRGDEPDWVAAEDERFRIATREIDAGRPVVLWGITMPEFAAVVGYEGDEYLYRWSGDGGQELRMPHAESSDPGGPYLLAFPSSATVSRIEGDRAALVNALTFLHRRPDRPEHRFGLEAYDRWIRALQGGHAKRFGNSYCAQCFGNAKQFARDFVTRLRDRNVHAEAPLDGAVIAYQECAEALDAVARLFPFPPGDDEAVADPIAIDDACQALTKAREAEVRAVAAIEAALAIDWPEA